MIPYSPSGYSPPARYKPQWYVGFLAFQNGFPRRRAGSLTGGGQIYGHEYQGTFQPVLVGYSTPVTNITAGGQINARPPFLTLLFGNTTTQGG